MTTKKSRHPDSSSMSDQNEFPLLDSVMNDTLPRYEIKTADIHLRVLRCCSWMRH